MKHLNEVWILASMATGGMIGYTTYKLATEGGAFHSTALGVNAAIAIILLVVRLEPS